MQRRVLWIFRTLIRGEAVSLKPFALDPPAGLEGTTLNRIIT